MSEAIFAPGYKPTPYWWEAAPRPELQEKGLPQQTDVAIIGSGYTGLTAAIALARSGRKVTVLDAEAAGWGCSSRNGGQVSTSLKPGLADLEGRHGREVGARIRQEGRNALQWIGDFISSEGIDCDWSRVGRFHAAHNSRAYERLARDVEALNREHPGTCHVVPKSEVRSEVGTDRYFGGAVYPAHASLHPGKYHLGLLSIAEREGAEVFCECRVEAIARDGAGHMLRTAKGAIRAREVLVATNGYTGELTPELRRRVIPIGSHIIATEELAPEVASRISPKNRVLSDTRKVVFYYRLSEDRRRIVFGGRVLLGDGNPRLSAMKLHAEMTQLFPELARTRITHGWMGFVAYTFDTLPHLGKTRDGLYYCMGYCGSGVSLASYFGTRIGQQIAGKAEGRTGLDGIPFQTRPLYTGNPWFLPASIAWYKLRDSLNV
ncbi:MAG: NAD(P)/FAD-dependent oxidoreductase [Parvibaculaceae bacterium]